MSHDNSLKKLQILDLKTNELTDTDITYNNILNFYTINDKIFFINLYKGTITINILNNKLKLKKKISKYVAEKEYHFKNKTINIFGKHYFIDENKIIWNTKLKPVLKLKKDLNIHKIKQIGNTIYFKERIGDIFYLSKIQFYKDNKLSPFFILLIIFEFILIFMYYYFRQILFLPFVSGESSYAVLYKIFGFIYFWKIYGRLSFYKFPKNISRNKNHFFFLLKEISSDYKEVYNKKTAFLQIRVFQLNPQNELFLVQRIAHDIKNQLHFMNLQLSEYEYVEDKKEKFKIFERIHAKMKYSLKQIQKKTVLLSGFSKLFNLKLEETDIVATIENIILEYSSHSRFYSLVFETQVSSYKAEIDENLFTIALRNMLDNALLYSKEDDEIKIKLTVSKENYHINISNRGKISDSILKKIETGQTYKSKSGGGVGIQITKKIIENFGGTFKIDSKDGYVIVDIILPRKVKIY